VHPDARQLARQAVVHLPEQEVSLARSGLSPGPLLGDLVHPRGGERDRRVPGEQLEQFGVVGTEYTPLVPAEHDAGPDDEAAPLQRHSDDPAQGGAVLRGDVAAGNLVIPPEPDRRAVRYHGSGHPLGEREHTARLAGHPDVGFFSVRARRLVDAADRPCCAAEQFGAAQQDALKQRAQRELAGQVLGDRDQAGRPRGSIVPAAHSCRFSVRGHVVSPNL
jgi:hypothetical protein